MKQMYFVIQALCATLCIGMGWGLFGDYIGLPQELTMVGSFLIGMFGFTPIHNWLTKTDGESNEK